jgi:hypothetical protein
MATRKPKTVAPDVTASEPVVGTQPAAKKRATKNKTQQSTTIIKNTKSPKDLANEQGQPYVAIVSVELDPDNVGNGAFELDWNDKFITKLVRAGYQSQPNESEDIIVDRWFQTICRNISMENFEQWEVNQPVDARPRNIDRRNIGGGRSEIS